MVPNLRHPEPGSKGVTRQNIVMQHIIDCIANKTGHDLNAHILRFEEEGTSRFGMVLVQYIDEMIGKLELLKGRVNDIRYEINAEDREKRNARRASVS